MPITVNAGQKAPKDLKAAGRALWKWLAENCGDVAGTEPMAAELCRLCDRLAEVREKIAAGELATSGKAHPLLNAEIKLTGQFQRAWRILGLSDRG